MQSLLLFLIFPSNTNKSPRHEEDVAQSRRMRNTTLAQELFYPLASTAHLPHSLPLDNYAGSYWYLAYKELTVEHRNQTLKVIMRRSSLVYELKIHHITGEFFFCIGYPVWNTEDPMYAPAEFKVDASGQAIKFGGLFEPSMSPKKI